MSTDISNQFQIELGKKAMKMSSDSFPTSNNNDSNNNNNYFYDRRSDFLLHKFNYLQLLYFARITVCWVTAAVRGKAGTHISTYRWVDAMWEDKNKCITRKSTRFSECVSAFIPFPLLLIHIVNKWGGNDKVYALKWNGINYWLRSSFSLARQQHDCNLKLYMLLTVTINGMEIENNPSCSTYNTVSACIFIRFSLNTLAAYEKLPLISESPKMS